MTNLSYLWKIIESMLIMEKFLFLGNIGAGEILIIALVVLLFFGGRKIPELMKGLGKGVRSFKDGMNEVEKDLDVNSPGQNGSTGNAAKTETRDDAAASGK